MPERDSIRACVEVTIETTDAWCEIAVRDDGPGFDNDLRDKLFEPFFTTKHRGSGLGLSTAKRVVEMHRGTLTAESGDGGGAVMRIRLPSSGSSASDQLDGDP